MEDSYSKLKKELNSTAPIFNIDDLSLDMPHRLDIRIKDTVIPCFFNKQNGDDMCIFLPGAHAPTEKLPRFSRWSRYPYVQGISLCLDDPMYYRYPNLKFGYFLGDNGEYLEYLKELIIKIATLFEVKYSNIIFFGSSAGGTVAINISKYFKDSIAIAINPQMLPFAPKRFDDHIYEITKKRLINIPNNCRTDKSILENKSKIVILCNKQSMEDYYYTALMMNKLNIPLDPLISTSNNTLFLFYNAPGTPDPHISFEDENIFRILMKLRFKLKLTTDFNIFNKKQECFEILSQIWSERYLLIRQKFDENVQLHLKYRLPFTDEELEEIHKSAYCGNLQSNQDLSLIYTMGLGTKQNLELAKKYSNNETYPEKNQLAIALFDLLWSKNNIKLDLYLYPFIEQYAKYPNSSAKIRCAKCLMFGRGIEKNVIKPKFCAC